MRLPTQMEPMEDERDTGHRKWPQYSICVHPQLQLQLTVQTSWQYSSASVYAGTGTSQTHTLQREVGPYVGRPRSKHCQRSWHCLQHCRTTPAGPQSRSANAHVRLALSSALLCSASLLQFRAYKHLTQALAHDLTHYSNSPPSQ